MRRLSGLILPFLWAVGLIFTAWFFQSLKLHYDNLQILNKAVRFYETGELVHFGNFGSGVGHIPGTLTTLLTAIPMKIYFSPYSAMAVIGLFHVFACWLMIKVGRLLEPDGGLTIFILLLFWLNPWRVEQAELYNPGYLPLFSMLHLWTAMKLREERHFGWTMLHALTIGLCAQIHFSAVILAAASALLWWTKRVRVHWGGFAAGAGLVLVSLVPYFLSLGELATDAGGNSSTEGAFFGRNLVFVYPLFKAALYWFRYGSTYYGRHIFTEIQLDYIADEGLRQVLTAGLRTFQFAIAALTLFFSIRWLGGLLKARLKRPLFEASSTKNFGEWFRDYFALLFVGMLAASALSPVEFNHWHLILCMPAVTLMMAWILKDQLSKLTPRRQRAILAAVFVWFSLQNSLAALSSRSHSWKYDFARDFDEKVLKSGQ